MIRILHLDHLLLRVKGASSASSIGRVRGPVMRDSENMYFNALVDLKTSV